jgi:hypothetical protein
VQPLQPIKHLNLESHSADNRTPATTINTLQQSQLPKKSTLQNVNNILLVNSNSNLLQVMPPASMNAKP